MASKLFISVVVLFGILVPQAQAQAPNIVSDTASMAIEAPKWLPQAVLETKEDIAAYALKKDKEGHFNGEFYATMNHESMGWQNVQSHYYKNGVQEKSYGICQINAPAHPDITIVQMYDPEWCLNWSAEQFKQGRQWMWSSWKLLYR